MTLNDTFMTSETALKCDQDPDALELVFFNANTSMQTPYIEVMEYNGKLVSIKAMTIRNPVMN